MSTLRKLERQVIRTKNYNTTGTTTGFKELWNTYRVTKFGENIPTSTAKKKQVHRDGKNDFIGALIYQKNAIKAYFDKINAEKSEAVDVVEGVAK